jgi:hypothetical protein
VNDIGDDRYRVNLDDDAYADIVKRGEAGLQTSRRLRVAVVVGVLVLFGLFFAALAAFGQDSSLVPGPTTPVLDPRPLVTLNPNFHPGLAVSGHLDTVRTEVHELTLPPGDSWQPWSRDVWVIPGGRWAHGTRAVDEDMICVHTWGSDTFTRVFVGIGRLALQFNNGAHSGWVDGVGLAIMGGWGTETGWTGILIVWDGVSPEAHSWFLPDCLPAAVAPLGLPGGEIAVLDAMERFNVEPPPSALCTLHPTEGLSRVSSGKYLWGALQMKRVGEELWVSARAMRTSLNEGWRDGTGVQRYRADTLEYLGELFPGSDIHDYVQVPRMAGVYLRFVGDVLRVDERTGATTGYESLNLPAGWYSPPYQLVWDGATETLLAQTNVPSVTGPFWLKQLSKELDGRYEAPLEFSGRVGPIQAMR